MVTRTTSSYITSMWKELVNPAIGILCIRDRKTRATLLWRHGLEVTLSEFGCMWKIDKVAELRLIQGKFDILNLFKITYSILWQGKALVC